MRNTTWFPGVLLVLAAAICAAAAAQDGDQDEAETPPEVERPKYNLSLRFREDWSVLKGVPKDGHTDFWDPIKYVPLSEDGKIWVSFGGSTRFRLESWWNFGFLPSSTGDDTFLLWRARLHADFHFGENLRVFVEGKSALSTNRTLPGGNTFLNVDTIALQQAFADVKFSLGKGTTLTLRPGRQQYLFGKQRLASPLIWSNTMRTWDGVTAILEWDNWRLDGFLSYFTPVKKYEFNTPNSNIIFYGAYAAGRLPDIDMGVDAYFFGLALNTTTIVNGTIGSQERYTLGGRFHGKIADTGFDYDVEGAYQFGRVDGGDVTAGMFGGQIGYSLPGAWSTPRFYVGFDYGSGDKTPGGNVQTFNQLFPLGHAFLGYIDIVGRQNILDPNLGVTFKPIDKMAVKVAAHFFWRDSTSDALYNAGGVPIRPGGVGTSSEVGQEIDFTVSYKFDRHTTALLGYSHFFAGPFIKESPPSNDIDFVYLQLQYTF